MTDVVSAVNCCPGCVLCSGTSTSGDDSSWYTTDGEDEDEEEEDDSDSQSLAGLAEALQGGGLLSTAVGTSALACVRT
jgi:hypothetical protein